MTKKKIAIIAGAVLLAIALFLVVKPKSFEKKFEKDTKDLTSYYLEANMEVTYGEDVRSYLVKSAWKKTDNTEYFRVSLYDNDLKQEQIILKNTDGVFVITPALNQLFQFKGQWPMNSPKPYLLQTIMEIVSQEHELVKEKDGWLVKANANYPSSNRLVTQEIKFSKDYKPSWLIAYNQDKIAELKLLFTSVEYDYVFTEDYFNVPTQKSSVTSSTEVELPLYPVSVFDSILTTNKTVDVNGQIQHVLEFSGERDFTIVESVRNANEELEVISMDKELTDGIHVIGYYDGTKLTVYDAQIEISVYSTDLSEEEMLQVVQSMRVAVMK